jgi:toxin ParE1/3/4
VKIIIRESAYADLENIYNWIAKDSLANANSVIERIRYAIENNLAQFPHMGRIGQIPGTREWVVRNLPHIVVYSVDEARGALTVLSIFHGAQRR